MEPSKFKYRGVRKRSLTSLRKRGLTYFDREM